MNSNVKAIQPPASHSVTKKKKSVKIKLKSDLGIQPWMTDGT